MQQYERDEGTFHSDDPPPMPNLEALDEELRRRIREQVHAELKPLIESEVEQALDRRLRWLRREQKGVLDG